MYKLLTSQIITVTTVPTALPTTAMTGRRYVTIQNVDNVTLYIGGSLVTANTAGTGGFQLLPRASWSELYSHAVTIYGIMASGATVTAQALVEEGR